MKFSVQYDPENDIIITSMTGEIDSEVIEAFSGEAIKLLSEHNCKRVLNDMRGAKLDFSTIDIYRIPKILDEARFPKSWKRAILVSDELEDYAFFETTSVNRGHRVKIFQDADEAIIWLRS
jgi:hypothetical protein